MNLNKNKKFLPFGKTEDGLFDIEEPTIGHFNRFQAKLNKQEIDKPKTNWYKYIAIAASLLLLISLGFKNNQTSKGIDLADVSPKLKETQDYFTTTIHKEMEKIAEIKNIENTNIINDSFKQLKILEEDYQKQKLALKNNSKNKTIIYIMINNYQKRIEILQHLLENLNKFNNIKNKYNENNTL